MKLPSLLIGWCLLVLSQLTGVRLSRVLELSDKFVEVSKEGTWFVMFYAPWCGHCKKLEPVWHQLSQSLHTSNIRVAKVDCTRFPNVASEFQVKGFPTTIFMKEGQNFHYHGDRTRDHLVDYAERMSLPPINIVEDKYMMKDIMKNQDTFFLYVGTNSGPVWESYNASAHEFQPHVYFYSVTHTILESSGVDSVPPTPSILVYKDRKFHMYQTGDPVALENRLPLESEETTAEPDVVQLHLPGLDDLRHWINHERFPSMVKITHGNFHQVIKTQKYIVIAVLEEDKVGRMSKLMRDYKEALADFALEHRHIYHEKFLFGWTGSPDLVNSVAMTTLPVPSLMVINATSFHHHFPEEHYESLSRENVAEFLNRILQNEIQAYGGTGVLTRAYRMYYDASTTLRGMWHGNPVLTTVILGLPLGFLSLICYSIWCADIMDANEDEPNVREKED